jgi:hypothetical protein
MICRVWECWALGSHLLHRTRTRVPMNQVGREREREVGLDWIFPVGIVGLSQYKLRLKKLVQLIV